jgi:hypothetical protein
MAAGKSDGSSDAASLALRIATVALSVASAAMMASASQRSCAGCVPASQVSVSYSDYSSLKYAHRTRILPPACVSIDALTMELDSCARTAVQVFSRRQYHLGGAAGGGGVAGGARQGGRRQGGQVAGRARRHGRAGVPLLLVGAGVLGGRLRHLRPQGRRRLQGLRRVLPAGPRVRCRLDGGGRRPGCVQVPEGRAGLDLVQG